MGCFYVNSSVTGNWEDYITKDLVSHIDRTYRTIPDARSRGIAGFSMGGFGTVNLALRHPEIYSVMFAVSPGLFAPDGLKTALSCGLWDTSFKQAYGAAFAPDPSLEDPFAGIPGEGASSSDKAILEKWERGFGNLESKINEYLTKKDKLRAIRIDYGRSDMYPWIISGCEYFSKLLTTRGIAHEFHTFGGGHEIYESTAINELAPFFSTHLEFK
jgi:S-formylglutathione hydrolase FrmB